MTLETYGECCFPGCLQYKHYYDTKYLEHMPKIKRKEHGFRSGKQTGNKLLIIVLLPTKICEQYVNCELMQANTVNRHRFPCNQTIEAGCVTHLD